MTVKYSDIVGVADEGSVSAEPDVVTGITIVKFRTAGVRFLVQYDALNEGIYGLYADIRRDNDWLRALKLMRKGAEQEAPGGAEEPNEPHEFVEDCDCHQCAIKQRDMAIWMLAEWAAAIDRNGTGWDDWDEYYKDTAFRPGPLRQRLDKAIAEVNAQNA